MAKLGTPQNVSLDGTVLSWDSVPGATAYNIYADNALYTTVINNVMPVIFKQSTTAVASAMSNTTNYPVHPGTLYFTKDNFIVRDYINSDGTDTRDIIHGKVHKHTVAVSTVTAGKVSVPSAFTISTTSTSASLTNGKTAGISVANHSFIPAGNITISSSGVTQGKTANYTPAGSVSKPTFAGTAATLSHAAHKHNGTLSTSDSGVKSLSHAAHSHTITGSATSTWTGTKASIVAAGSVSQPTFTGAAVSYTPAGNVSVTQNAYHATVEGEVLTLTPANIAASFSGTAASITAKGTVSKPSFTGSGVDYTPAGSVTTTLENLKASSATVTAHSVSIPDTVTIDNATIGAHSYTPTGSVSQPSFTGTGAIISGAFAGDTITLNHTVTQGTVTGTVSYDKTTNITVKSNTDKAVTLTTATQTLDTTENS